MKNINITIVRKNFLWFEVYHANHPEVINSEIEPDENAVMYTSNFDYEKLSLYTWRVYIDLGIKLMPKAGILVRLAFEFFAKGITWDHVFTLEMIKTMVIPTMEQTVIIFKEQCEAVGIEIPYEIPFSNEVATQISQGIIDKYHNDRKLMDVENAVLMNQPGLESESQYDSQVLLKCPFMILDELFYNSTRLDKKHYLDIFADYIPEPKYFTIKMNCGEIDKRKVVLNLCDTILFYLCVDCALQMLVGDNADELMTALEPSGMNEKLRDDFLKVGTLFFEQYNTEILQPGVKIMNTEKKYDWNDIFR